MVAKKHPEIASSQLRMVVAFLRSPRHGGAAVFALALAVRLLYVGLTGAANFTVSDDGQAYHDIALNLLGRGEFITAIDPPHKLDEPYANRPPLTPLFLAGVYAVTGPSPAAAQVALAFVGALGCLLAAVLGRQLFGATVGLLAGLLAALNPFFVFLTSVPLTENLAIPLYVGLAILLVRIHDHARPRDAWLAGAVIGFAALNKPTALSLFPFLILWLAISWRRRPQQVGRIVLPMVIAAMLVILPWTVRNYLRLGLFVPVTTQAGGALYAANGFQADYAISKLENGATGWYGMPGAGVKADGLTRAEQDRMELAAAAAFIREHPQKFLEQAYRKVRIFWGAYPHPIHRVSWAATAILSLIGLALSLPAWRRLMPLYLVIVQTVLISFVFTAMPRFRAPVEPYLLVLAAVALVAFTRGGRITGDPNRATPGYKTLVRMQRLTRYNRCLWRQLAPFVGDRVIEAGSGIGNFTSFLLDRAKVIAVDLDSNYVSHLQERIGHLPNVRVLKLDLNAKEADVLVDEKLDTVICMNVLEHLEDDRGTLESFYRLLQPGGRLVLVVPAHAALHGAIDRHIGHYRRYQKSEVAQKLEQAGFQTESAVYFNALGALGWFVNSIVLRRKEVPGVQAYLFDWLVPLLAIERRVRMPFGLSVIAVGRKPGPASVETHSSL
jgi:4-amino-4-deoxy-L-arabinose transferase-like glycosyltransferase